MSTFKIEEIKVTSLFNLMVFRWSSVIWAYDNKKKKPLKKTKQLELGNLDSNLKNKSTSFSSTFKIEEIKVTSLFNCMVYRWSYVIWAYDYKKQNPLKKTKQLELGNLNSK